MLRISSHKILVALAFAGICFGGIAVAQVAPMLSLSVDMPHGGCSLTVRQDGSASVHFGAMPKWVRAASKTFDFDQLVKELRDKSHSHNTLNSSEHPVGSLSLPKSNELLWINNEELVRSLLKQAWRARLPPNSPHKFEDYEWVSKACLIK